MRKAIVMFTVAACLLTGSMYEACCRNSQGCAVAPPRDIDVRISDETALIIWDQKSSTEHFIRNASFETQADSFGFLVPTPTVPVLHESGGRVLTELAVRTAARHERREVVEETFRLFRPGTGFDFYQRLYPSAAVTGALPDAATGVQVIDEVSVAGYDAAILKATDSEELLRWLEEHDYAARPALLDWLEVYTSQNWYLTAFRISRQPDGSRAVARPVRMTFQTDRPFYPYREPSDAGDETQSPQQRLL
ncbi:MAG: DUF2330 domain-containing protein, partial [Planctomycetaceae bacterium]|nr:DUF2330 domain-containing protein [Planctomycetaceae bacterium]